MYYYIYIFMVPQRFLKQKHLCQQRWMRICKLVFCPVELILHSVNVVTSLRNPNPNLQCYVTTSAECKIAFPPLQYIQAIIQACQQMLSSVMYIQMVQCKSAIIPSGQISSFIHLVSMIFCFVIFRVLGLVLCTMLSLSAAFR